MKVWITSFLILNTLNAFSVEYAKSIRSKFNNKNINYLIHTPNLQLKTYPLLVFLHGVGEKPTSDEPLNPIDLQKLKKHGPAKLIASKHWPADLPFIVASIQCFKDCKFHRPEIINEVIIELISSLPIDQSRIYLTGISMGGNGVMRFLAHYPNTIAAAVPIAGWGAGNWCEFSNTAYWGLHNKGDQIVKVNGTKNAYKALKSCPKRTASTKITILPLDGHDAWTKTYEDFGQGNIYQFLLSHRLY